MLCTPQESILGPLLFIIYIYIHDLSQVLDVLKPIMFANATNLFCLNNDIKAFLKYKFGT